MAFQISPGVNVSEIDLSNVIPAVSTTRGGLGGLFRWGPINQPILVSSEKNLVQRFGRPTNFNAETFFTAADFLAYSNALYVVRADNGAALHTAGLPLVSSAGVLINNAEEAEDQAGTYFARHPGALGNSLMVSICPASAFVDDVASLTIAVGSDEAVVTAAANLTVGDVLSVGNSSLGFQEMEIETVTNPDQGAKSITFTTNYNLKAPLTGGDECIRYWGHKNSVDKVPETGKFHVVVVDIDGSFSAQAGTVLEVYQNLSVVSTDKSEDGSTIYYRNVINAQSNYIWAGSTTQSVVLDNPVYLNLAGTVVANRGNDGTATNESSATIQDIGAAYDQFKSGNDIDISLLMQGKAIGSSGDNFAGLAIYITGNIVDSRRDCVFYVSPDRADVIQNTNAVNDMIDFRNSVGNSSYVFIDSGYKQRYDKYNDIIRFTPLNGDMAGLAARSDNDRDPWFSPAGLARGNVKNVIKLGFNPNKAERDLLYPNDINPVITQPGQGTVLFGDKTAQGHASAFDRVNVRRLFIVIEKAIATASQSILFEFNDSFTRGQFINLVEPFLREVQGRRGIQDFRVVSDETNNTPEVIDQNGFVGDIYIKPTRSVNFIQLNFVATRSGIEFDEIVGK